MFQKGSENCLRTDNPHDSGKQTLAIISKRPIVVRSLSQNKGLLLGQVMLLFLTLSPTHSSCKPSMGAGAKC